ncbi:MAG: MOSC domain-containing protein [Acidobacteriota bacterium]|nr:MOSC domain-containing protein [Acidobacteriota bacterium]
MTGLLQQISRSNGGLPKHAVAGPVMLGYDGIEGDRHRNLKYHGGPNKAVLMISAEWLEELALLGYPVIAGSLGENLTVSGFDRGLWRTGQRYRVGSEAVIELTTLRSPCLNLDVYGPSIKNELYDARCKAGDFESPRWAKGGFYARVVRPGLLNTGMPIELEWDLA